MLFEENCEHKFVFMCFALSINCSNSLKCDIYQSDCYYVHKLFSQNIGVFCIVTLCTDLCPGESKQGENIKMMSRNCRGSHFKGKFPKEIL